MSSGGRDQIVVIHPRLVASKPSAGAPAGQVSNSQGAMRGVGVVVLEDVPDLLSAGADKITLSRGEKMLLQKEERSYVVFRAI